MLFHSFELCEVYLIILTQSMQTFQKQDLVIWMDDDRLFDENER